MTAIRKLGLNEIFMNSLIRVGTYSNFQIHISFKEDLHLPTFLKVIDIILERSPIFNVFIRGGEIYPAGLNAKDIIQDDRSNQLPKEDYLKRVIDPYKFQLEISLLRFFIKTDSSLFIVMDHSIFDGKTIVELAKDVAMIYRSVKNNEDIDYSVEELSPPLEELVNFTESPTSEYGSEEISKVWRSGSKSESFDALHEHKIVNVPLDGLREKLRFENISFLIFIQHAWLKAHLKIEPPENYNLAYVSAYGIDLRSRIKSPKKFGYHSVGGGDIILERNSNLKQLRKKSHILKEKLITGDIYHPYWDNIKAIPQNDDENPWDSSLEKGTLKVCGERGWTLFTPIGKITDHSGLIKDINFGQTTNNLSYLFAVSVSEFDSQFRFHFTMVQNDKITNEQFLTIINEFLEFLKDTRWLQ